MKNVRSIYIKFIHEIIKYSGKIGIKFYVSKTLSFSLDEDLIEARTYPISTFDSPFDLREFIFSERLMVL